MLTRERASNIFDRIRKYSTADEVEMIISGGQSALTRFANNTIHQNVAEEQYHISVRTSFSGRTARASTNRQDDDSLRRVVAAAEALARVQQPDSDLLPMPTPQEVAASDSDSPVAARYFAVTAAITPDERAQAVAEMVKVAKRHKLTAAGVFSSSSGVEGIFNSRGVSDWYEQTLAEASVSMLDDSSSGWQKANSPDCRQLDPAGLAEIAAQKALASRAPRELSPGKYTVILEPAAVLDIVGFMFWDFSGTALLDQRSFLNDRMGTALFGDNITVWDDVYHPLQTGVWFDGEGMKRERVKLIEKGVVRAVTYSRSSAKRMQASGLQAGPVRPTGHGFALPNEIGEAPLNIVFAPPPAGQEQSVAQMIASTERGVLITRFWYIREVDPYEKVVTGMTRDGTFLVEHGKVQHGIHNLRFNESLIHMLQNVRGMSASFRSSGEESPDMVVPAMRIIDFNFTEMTRF